MTLCCCTNQTAKKCTICSKCSVPFGILKFLITLLLYRLDSPHSWGRSRRSKSGDRAPSCKRCWNRWRRVSAIGVAERILTLKHDKALTFGVWAGQTTCGCCCVWPTDGKHSRVVRFSIAARCKARRRAGQRRSRMALRSDVAEKYI